VVIAVSGKGGTGKTTFSALAVDYLVRTTGKAVLAVDADSNANLDQALGTRAEKTIGAVREYLTENVSRIPAGMSKEVWVETMLRQALVEEKGFDLISMGRPEGPGCYCYLNNIFRRYLDIMTKQYEYVVMDNEAGMEHLSRRTTRGVDLMFIASDPTAGCAPPCASGTWPGSSSWTSAAWPWWSPGSGTGSRITSGPSPRRPTWRWPGWFRRTPWSRAWTRREGP
jgi:CO dehydrogenase nickel-insertion accessory protein CooC1